MKRILTLLFLCFAFPALYAGNAIHLTLIPPGKITDKVELDIRAGVLNEDNSDKTVKVSIYWDKEKKANLLYEESLALASGKSGVIKHIIPTAGRVGSHQVILKVKDGRKTYRKVKDIEIISSDKRSIEQISGAWAGIYHWSEIEGKHWNQDIKKMTDSQWQEMVRSMKKIDMNMMVIQEVFRNEYYVGRHSLNVDNYEGKAFYPSKLYPGRMPITAEDPIEAILSEADRQGMQVLIGVGMFAWFDFTPESLEWHKRVAKELWDMYGHHESFYAFYISEESGGGLDNWEQTPEKRQRRKDDIVNFFKEFKAWTNSFAPAKPVMLATNSFEVPNGMDTYPELMKHLDILCPFGFARMPENDLSGKEAADMLQAVCDKVGSHLWFDLESFLFNPDNSLYPRPVEQIIHDLNLFDNFEKILCYQFPGVFNDPEMSIRIGEESTIELFKGYQKYLELLEQKRNRTKVENTRVILPVTGSFINLAYKDVRNKYTNPLGFDNMDPAMWDAKVREMADMGIEYLVLMEVANDGKAFYPSKLMDLQYNPDRKSPVEAILDAAADCGVKVFLSSGWAKNQDDNLRIPAIKQRQLQIMDEIGTLYKNKPAFYGWYLPVEDCIDPIFPKHAVDAVNALVAHARELTPGKKTLISPYGLSMSDFDNPEYEKTLAQLKVDIIAYQDEVGCVREATPLPELRQNWKRLRQVHDKIGIEMWANCENFTWEKGTNDRSSALLPASYQRFLSQQVAASVAGVDRIISFMYYGIVENPSSQFRLGQPEGSNQMYNDYMAWKSGSEYWKLCEAAYAGRLLSAIRPSSVLGDKMALADGILAEEDPLDPHWVKFQPGYNEVIIDLSQANHVDKVMVRLLNYHLLGIELPDKFYLYASDDAQSWRLATIEDSPAGRNNRHDPWCDAVLLEPMSLNARYLKVTFNGESPVYMDEIFVNPQLLNN